MLAGHTLVLQRLSGPGTVFVHAAGDFAGFTLGPGEVLRADTAALVWFDASVDYSAAWAGTVKRALLGALLRKSKLAPSAPTRRFVTDRSRTTLVDQARSFD